jgi:hypothetical protein
MGWAAQVLQLPEEKETDRTADLYSLLEPEGTGGDRGDNAGELKRDHLR